MIDEPAVVVVPRLLTIAHAAEILDCSTWTVRRRIDAGELPAVRESGRTMLRGDDLRAYIDGLEAVGKVITSRQRPAGRRRYPL